jgi:hypothetical protein
MQPSQRRYACLMRLAAAGFAVFAFAACGGLVAPDSGGSGASGPGADVPGSESTGNATQSSAGVGAGAANGGTGANSASDASQVAVMPSATMSGASESNGMPGGAGNNGSSGASNGAPLPPPNNGAPGAPPITGAPGGFPGSGASASSGTGSGGATSGSVGTGFGFGFTSNDGGLTGGGSCPVSSGPVTCEALPAQIDPSGQSAFSGNWPGCQYMVCFGETCVNCTCMASGPQAIWVCGTSASQGPPIQPRPPR